MPTAVSWILLNNSFNHFSDKSKYQLFLTFPAAIAYVYFSHCNWTFQLEVWGLKFDPQIFPSLESQTLISHNVPFFGVSYLRSGLQKCSLLVE